MWLYLTFNVTFKLITLVKRDDLIVLSSVSYLRPLVISMRRRQSWCEYMKRVWVWLSWPAVSLAEGFTESTQNLPRGWIISGLTVTTRQSELPGNNGVIWDSMPISDIFQLLQKPENQLFDSEQRETINGSPKRLNHRWSKLRMHQSKKLQNDLTRRGKQRKHMLHKDKLLRRRQTN